MQENARAAVAEQQCAHERWQYCRRMQNGEQQFGAQCLDCMDMVKLRRHGYKLLLRASDIPANAPIHAWISGGCNE